MKNNLTINIKNFKGLLKYDYHLTSQEGSNRNHLEDWGLIIP
jgi:hypothetical protein